MSCHSIELSSCLREPQFFIKMHKEGRSAMRRPSFAISPRRSADVIDPFLVRSFFRCFRLRRQLQHPGLLALAQQRQLIDRPSGNSNASWWAATLSLLICRKIAVV